MNRSIVLGLALAMCWMICASTTFAAVISGTIESVSAADNQFSIRYGANATRKTFKLAPTAQVTLQGKKAALDQLESGLSVTVTTDSKGETATKIVARIATETTPKPAATPKARPSSKKSSREPAEAATGDWPQHRGPRRDNISTEKGLLLQWPAKGPRLDWKTDGLGEGYSSLAIVGDTIYTMGTIGRDEHLFALDRNGGKRKWSVRTGANRNDGTGNGPRGTPTVDGDHVYALGANGDLVCAKTDDGEVVWNKNILQEFSASNIGWGICESVLIDGDKLICTPGGRNATMVALNKQTGEPIWRSVVQGSPSAAYSSAIAIDVGGVRQYVNYVHTAVVGVRASDGTPLWGQRESANGTANISTPLFTDGHVFTASAYDTGCALFRLASSGGQTRSDVVYSSRQMKNHHGGMVLLDGFVYGSDDAILTCLDLRSGKPAWQNRSVGKGSLIFADGHLYLRSENGPIALIEATPRSYVEKGRFDQPDRSNKPSWSHPVIAGGRLYLRDQDTLLAYDVRE